MSDIVSELKGKAFPVLDDGFVRLVDVMGDDAAIVQAARTSYQNGTKRVSEDRDLLRYLMRNQHSSPFESCQIKLFVRLPIFVERQWARHRTAGWNEVSGRYSELPEEFYVPDACNVKAQSQTNKQGRGEELPSDVVDDFVVDCETNGEAVFEDYRKHLSAGVSREIARINLPLSTYTEKVWWINLHNIFHFLGLRMDSHAQLEIRQYATTIGEQIVAPLFPIAWQAFLDYRFNATSLSALEQRAIVEREFRPACLQVEYGMSKREVGEYLEKCEKLGLMTK